MGGFRLRCLETEKKIVPSRFGYPSVVRYTGNDIRIWELPLSLGTMKTAYNQGVIDLPCISKDDIMDKCGRDALSKTLAVLQLAWFILQIAARARQNLVVTELELTTAALASLNIAMYISWWSKPTDILCPTLLESKKLHDEKRGYKGKETSLPPRSESDGNHVIPPDVAHRTPPSTGVTQVTSESESGSREERDVTLQLGDDEEVILVYHYLRELKELLVHIITSPVRATKEAVKAIPLLCNHVRKTFARYFQSDSTPASSGKDTNIEKAIRKARKLVGHLQMSALLLWNTISHLFLALIYYPTLAILGGQKREPTDENTLPELKRIQSFQLAFDKDALPVVMDMVFFCENVVGAPFLCLSAFSGAMFGLIHCLAWNFAFPSHVEQVLWRVSSTVVAGLCIGVMTIALVFIVRPVRQRGKVAREKVSRLGENDSSKQNTSTKGEKPSKLSKLKYLLSNHEHLGTKVLCTIFAVCFVSTRFSLISLSIIGLRALPASAFDTVQWSGFIPHI